MKISFLKKLVEIVESSDIDELEVRKWWTKIRITRRHPYKGQNPVVAVETRQLEGVPRQVEKVEKVEKVESKQIEEAYLEIKSPMVGTFYRAPSPGSKPYVEVGDRVEKGQVVCIIEAMKLMNEIQSEVSGKVTKILVENAQPVEYGQTLFLVSPD
ncbi:MAG: acetyl-CoA carboxylase biotin carboxyl carrier protein [bacterium]